MFIIFVIIVVMTYEMINDYYVQLQTGEEDYPEQGEPDFDLLIDSRE